MPFLRQSTAATVKFGPFLGTATGDSDLSGLIIQKADVLLSKNGDTLLAANSDQGEGDTGAPYDSLGYYNISLNTTDTNEPGILKISVHKSGSLHVFQTYDVISQDVYDMIIGDSRGEPGQEAPGVSIHSLKKIDYLYKDMRNKKTSTTTSYNLYNNSGDTIGQTATISYNGTIYTRDELGSGS
jgi:hypothetical protein